LFCDDISQFASCRIL